MRPQVAHIILLLLTLGVDLTSMSQFAPPKKIDPILKNPVDGLFADLNGDGLEDILVIAEQETGYFRNLGEEYSELILLTDEYHFPTACDVGDINGDGHLDVIVAYEEQGELIWLENDGDGIFSEPQTIILINPLNSIHCRDFDNDGLNDLLYYDGLTSEVVLALGIGAGEFEEGEVIVTDVNSNELEVADLDGDGNLDFVGPSSILMDVSIHWGGNGNFSEEFLGIDGTGTFRMGLADVNNNGTSDIIGIVGNDLWKILVKDDGTVESMDIIGQVNTQASLVATKIFDSGYTDLLVLEPETQILTRFFNGGNDQFVNEQFQVSQLIRLNILFDSDRHAEGTSLLYTSEIGLHMANGIDELLQPNNAIVSTHLSFDLNERIDDLDQDGESDMIGISDQYICVFYGRTDDKWDTDIVYRFDVSCSGLATIDIDQDGSLDIVFSADSPNEVSALIQDSPRSWSQVESLLETAPIDVLKTADIDNNGFDDIACKSDNHIIVYFSNGDGMFIEQDFHFSNYLWNEYEFFDGDEDGDLDVYLFGSEFSVAEYDNGYLPLVLISGGIVAIEEVAVGDLDLDGIADIIELTSLGAINLLKGEGNFEYQSAGILDQLGDPKDVKIAQVSGDGLKDAFVLSEEGNLFVYENTGNLEFISSNVFQMNSSADRLVCGDEDADGDIDVWIVLEIDSGIVFSENLISGRNLLKGHTFLDFSGNGILDPEDIPFPFVKMRLEGLDTYYYSNVEGDYTTYSDTGTFTVFPEFDESLFAISTPDLSYTVTLSEDNPVSEGHDFGFTPIDWQEKINGEFITESPRCDQEVIHWLSVSNEGNSIPSGVVAYELDELCQFVDANPAPDSTNENIIYFSYSDLFYFSQEEIEVVVQMPEAELPMPWLTHYMTTYAEDELGDQYAVNIDSLSQQLLCGYDPNDKLEEIGYTAEGFITPDDTMEYTVRFQNTGNDTVFCCMIRDQLPYFVDRSTIHPIQWSHDFELNIESDGEAVFRFDNVNLVDSATSPTASQGFVKFTAQPVADVADGTKIYNTADIYFDLNPPITTNTFVNEIYDCAVGIEMILNQSAFCLGDTLEAAHGYKGLSSIEWQLGILESHDTIFCTVLDEPGEFFLFLLSDDPLCGSRSDSILITVSEMIAPELLTEPEPICEGESIMLTSIYLEGNNWYFENSLISESPYVMANQEGSYELQINNEGCLSPFLSVGVDVISTPQALASALDSAICFNESTILLANDAGAYEWWHNEEQVGTDQAVLADGPGQYILITYNEDCPSAPDSIDIGGLDTPQAQIIGDAWMCDGDSLLLTSTSSEGNTWFLDGAVVGFEGDIFLNTPGELSLLVDNGICTSETSAVLIEQVALPIANANSLFPAFCSGESVIIEADNAQDYAWYLENILVGQDDEFMINAPGIYQLKIKENGCWSLPVDIVATELELPPQPEIYESGPSLICSVDGVGLNHLWWFYTEQIGDSDEVVFYPQQTGVYRVSVVDQNGCASHSPQISFVYTSIERQNLNIGSAFPNPFSDYLRVDLNAPAVLELYNNVGQRVAWKKFPRGMQKWNLQHLAVGTYTMKLLSADTSSTSKFIKK